MLVGLLLNFLACLDELDGVHRTKLVPEEITHRGLKHIVHQVLHGSHHRDDFRCLGVRHMDEHLQIDFENESLVTLSYNRLEIFVQTVGAGHFGGPIQLENRGRHNLRLVNTRIDRVLAGTERVFPQTAMAGFDQRTELEVRSGGILRDQADVGFDRGRFTLFDYQHGNNFHPHQERIQGVGPVPKHIVLQTHFASSIQECLKVLIVIVRRIFIA